MSRARIAPWIICPTCSGVGHSSRHLGVVDPHSPDWSPDEFEEYLSGAYDRPCNTCNGTGKVRDDDEAIERHNAVLRYERMLDTGRNEAGEPMW